MTCENKFMFYKNLKTFLNYHTDAKANYTEVSPYPIHLDLNNMILRIYFFF